MILHVEVQPILDSLKGRTVGECVALANQNVDYLNTQRARDVLTEDELRQQKTIWNAVWGIFFQMVRSGRVAEVW